MTIFEASDSSRSPPQMRVLQIRRHCRWKGLRAAELVDHRQVRFMSSGTPVTNLFSFTEPLGPPSPLDPLAETDDERVLELLRFFQVVEQTTDLVILVREKPA
jgi:hypothetical protein